ncbi:MAG: hypothetical protein LUD72_00085 [Bacteroidales bacterium]|nr:hypothetical protein [Bacteroidales bacterium]
MTVGIDLNEVIRDFLRQFANCYVKGIDPNFDIEYEKMDDFNLMNVFPFINEDDENDRLLYHAFRYEDYAFEIHSRADLMERNLIGVLNTWINGDLCNFDEDKNPDVVIVSPLEGSLSLPSTLGFLSRVGLKAREFYFPVDSMTIWDRCDILITANPKLIENCPEGKTVLKINAPYNTKVKAEHSYDSIKEIMYDPEQLVKKLIEK